MKAVESGFIRVDLSRTCQGSPVPLSRFPHAAAAFQNIITSHGLQALDEKLGLTSQVGPLLIEGQTDEQEAR